MNKWGLLVALGACLGVACTDQDPSIIDGSGGSAAVGGGAIAVGGSASDGATVDGLVGGSGGVSSQVGGSGGSLVDKAGGTTTGVAGSASGGMENAGGSSAGGAPASGGAGTGGETATAECSHLQNWPDGTSPEAIGKKLVEQFLTQNNADRRHYKLACAWYGALSLAAQLGEQGLVDQLIAAYDVNFYATEFDNLVSGREADHPQGHVDENVFGIVPLEISLHDSNSAYLEQGLSVADQQQANINTHIRYAIDDMFMITSLQMQSYRATGEAKYLDLAAETMVKYLDTLQQSDGTFHHRDTVPIRWGRGNGWVASGMTELMRDLVDTHPDYGRIVDGYRSMMAGLLAYQIESGDGEGLWKQVLDDNSGQNWAETSGSAMFTYAMVSGVNTGALECDIYGPVARSAWLGLVAALDGQDRLAAISDWMYDGSIADYLARERVVGDNHGQAPFMWAAGALLR